MERDMLFKVALSAVKGMNFLFARNIYDTLDGNLERFFTADSRELALLFGGENRILSADNRARALESAKSEIQWIASCPKVTPLFFADEGYPSRLLECEDAPIVLYCLGDIACLDSTRVLSIVGTRRSTVYGQTFVHDFVSGLRERMKENLLIVSGLAYGTDVAAHRESLAAGITTVGVVAHGLSTLYPAAHRDVAAKMIAQGGALVTEYRHSAPVHRGNFLERNRIVAGMCDALIVVESDIQGGAMATASNANAYSREVFALPGRVSDRFSRGCNHLIYNYKASLLSSADDFLKSVGWPVKDNEGKQASFEFELNKEEAMIVKYLTDLDRSGRPYDINRMSVELNMELNVLAAMLGEMEMDDILIRIPAGGYRPRKT